MKQRLFHFYFAVANEAQARLLLEMRVQRMLVSYAHLLQLEKPARFLEQLCKSDVSLMLDSGRELARQRSVALQVEDYTSFVLEHSSLIDRIASFSGIGESDVEYKRWMALRQRLKEHKVKALQFPIYHEGSHWKWAKRVLSLKPDGLCIGTRGRVLATRGRRVWVKRVFDAVQERKGRSIAVHGSALPSFPLLSSFPFDSADTATWLRFSSAGLIYSRAITGEWGPLVLSKRFPASGKYAGNLDAMRRLDRGIVIQEIERLGFSRQRLLKSRRERCLYNVLCLQAMEDELNGKSQD